MIITERYTKQIFGIHLWPLFYQLSIVRGKLSHPNLEQESVNHLRVQSLKVEVELEKPKSQSTADKGYHTGKQRRPIFYYLYLVSPEASLLLPTEIISPPVLSYISGLSTGISAAHKTSGINLRSWGSRFKSCTLKHLPHPEKKNLPMLFYHLKVNLPIKSTHHWILSHCLKSTFVLWWLPFERM